MPFFEYDKTKIHYVDVDRRQDTSVGLPLLFIHGAGSSHFSWALQLVEFSKTNRCIAIDLSGHGKSENGNGEASIDKGFAYEVASLVSHLDLQEFILVGHSMGGGVAMSYVLNDTFRSPTALVLVDSSPDLNLTKVLPGLFVEAVEETSKVNHDAFDEYAEKLHMKQYEKAMKHLDSIAMQSDLRACKKFNVSDRIKDIAIPTFALVGEDDDVITPAIVKEYIERIPRADLAVVRGADHVPMIEQPEAFNRLFRKFITWVQKTA
ncbi:MAG: alpha/beta fold hydrolase [Candidatus Thorarchaeota archaeon]